LAAAGNATALGVTSAYAAGGWPGMAAAGGAAVLAAGGAVVHRRRAVKRSADIRKALRAAGLGGGSLGSGGGRGFGLGGGSSSRRGGLFGGGSGGGRKSAAAGSSRGASGSRSGGGSTAPSRGGRAGGSNSPRAGKSGAGASTGSSGRLGRALDRMLGGSGQKAGVDKAARKSASETAAAAKSVKAARKAAKAAAKQARKDLGLPSRSSRLAAASKRGAGRAWSKTASPRAAARRLAARSVRKARGLTADGLRSLRAGVWGLLKHMSWKKGGKRALAAWKAHRAKRKTTTPAAPPTPPIASTVRRPASTTPIRSSGGPGMSGYHFVAPATEGVRAAANYNPTGMLQVIEDFAGLSEALELHAQAMRVTVENADAKFPLAPQVIDVMRQVHNLQLKAAELAKELQPASRKLHEADLARHSSPRKGPQGERMWDIASNS
jgi:hypothetical protein